MDSYDFTKDKIMTLQKFYKVLSREYKHFIYPLLKKIQIELTPLELCQQFP